MDKIKKGIGYIRVSTSRQDLERQKLQLRSYCSDNGINLLRIIEEKVSGAKENRSSIKELEKLDAKNCDIVIVSELSRLSREDSIRRTINYIGNLVEDNGINVVFLDNPLKVYSGTLDEFELIQIIFLAVGAREERKKINERAKSGMDAKFYEDTNVFRGSIPPFGFKVIHNPKYLENEDRKFGKKILVIDEQESLVVKQIFDLISKGKSLRDTVTTINNSGYRNKGNKKFTDQGLRYILNNKMYIGIITRNKTEYKLPFRIIDDNLFNLAKKNLQNNKWNNTTKRNFNPLSRILHCPCGYSFMIKENMKNNFIYKCVRKVNQLEGCTNSGINATVIQNTVWDNVKSNLSHSDYRKNNDERIIKINEEIELIKLQISSLKDDNISIAANIEVFNSRLLLATSDSAFKAVNKKLMELESNIDFNKEEIKKLETKILELNEEINTINNVDKEGAFFDALTDESKAELYQSVIKKIVYYSESKYNGFIHIIYKNGIESTSIIRNTKYSEYYIIPSFLKFDMEKRVLYFNQPLQAKNDSDKIENTREDLTFKDVLNISRRINGQISTLHNKIQKK